MAKSNNKQRRKAKPPPAEPPPPLPPNVFEGIDLDTAVPCPVCLKLAKEGQIQPRAVMPLPPFPARLKSTGEQCCRDCQSTEIAMEFGAHPMFGPARLCVANERCESLVMPAGMAYHFGMCHAGFVRYASIDDLDRHLAWCTRHGIPNCAYGGTEF